MARDKFELILQFLHVVDNSLAVASDHPDHDRLFKIKPMLTHLIQCWQTAYYPCKEVSVDESIIAFKGRSHMVVYKPAKPHKWGIINAWVLAESSTGYVWNMDIYTGRKAVAEVGLTKKVVVSLCEPLSTRSCRVHG